MKPPRLLEVGQRVKLAIKQPEILCEGRKQVECYIRGKIYNIDAWNIFGPYIIVEFKMRGVQQLLPYCYNRKTNEYFLSKGYSSFEYFKDLKIIKIYDLPTTPKSKS